MEYVEGKTLTNAIQDNMPRDGIWNIIGQVASAARFLEGRGLAAC
jgi:hypothetical protein